MCCERRQRIVNIRMIALILAFSLWKEPVMLMLGLVPGRADFFRGLLFLLSRRIFSADFVAGFSVCPHVCGKKCPEKSSWKIPSTSSKIFIQQRSPTHFCRGARANECQENLRNSP